MEQPGNSSKSPVEVLYYHTDHLSTPRELTDNDGPIVWSATYKAWGSRAKIDRLGRLITDIQGNVLLQRWEQQGDLRLHSAQKRRTPDAMKRLRDMIKDGKVVSTMLDNFSPLELTYKLFPAKEGGHYFVSMFLEIDDLIIGDSGAISVLGLVVGETNKVINKLSEMKNNSHDYIEVGCIDINDFFDYSFEFVLGKMKDPIRHEIFGEIISRTVVAFPFANECFDGEIGFLSYLGGDSGFLMWRDFKTMEINTRLISYSSYVNLWQGFIVSSNGFVA